MQLYEIGQLLQRKRTEFGLTQEQLGHMVDLSRATINALEKGKCEIGFSRLAKLCSLLSIELVATPHAHETWHNGLKHAAQSTNVSYRTVISPEIMSKSLASGDIPPGYEAQMYTLVDETPWPLVADAVREAASLEHVVPKVIWGHLEDWAAQTQSPRWKKRAKEARQ